MGNGRYGDELSQGKPLRHLASTIRAELNHGLKLVTMDEEKTVIAKFHRKHYFTKKQKARLEVQPAGMGMLDYIVLTFVFVENKRRERERSVAASASVA